MGKNWWSEPMGGCDSEGNPITVSFGSGPKEGHTLIGDGVGGSLADGATHYSFLESDNHDHYGPGNGSNNNGTHRGQYTGPGH